MLVSRLLSCLGVAATVMAVSGCGSAGTGSACKNLRADTEAYGRYRAKANRSPSEEQALAKVEREIHEAYKACGLPSNQEIYKRSRRERER